VDFQSAHVGGHADHGATIRLHPTPGFTFWLKMLLINVTTHWAIVCLVGRLGRCDLD